MNFNRMPQHSVARGLLSQQAMKRLNQPLPTSNTDKSQERTQPCHVWVTWGADRASARGWTQAAFHVFGMELLCCLDLNHTDQFFSTFFKLPAFFWRGFLGSTLDSVQLLAFAMVTFAIAPIGIKAKLVAHLTTHPAGQYLLRGYLGACRWSVRMLV